MSSLGRVRACIFGFGPGSGLTIGPISKSEQLYYMVAGKHKYFCRVSGVHVCVNALIYSEKFGVMAILSLKFKLVLLLVGWL